ncbi:hypothetical protein tinsulaeT_16940 [Thalassotalea insulae]|uniref:Uncharacterized protein n=1 Tax=Thalassotalea insulae TaxID=2056778 RepID=A0ABQ6GT69_9GAMM|nr:hypothetical protein tinsulaeT_16940 [Thalassotalea insulae]
MCDQQRKTYDADRQTIIDNENYIIGINNLFL